MLRMFFMAKVPHEFDIKYFFCQNLQTNVVIEKKSEIFETENGAQVITKHAL